MALPEPLTRKEKFWADIIEYRGGGGGGDDDWSMVFSVSVVENAMNPKLGMALQGDALIDWGDGTTSEMSGEQGEFVTTPHEYIATGEHTVKVKITGAAKLVSITGGGGGGSSVQCPFLWQTATGAPNMTYPNRILSIEIRDGITDLQSSAFSGAIGLTSVNIVGGVTNIGMSAFRSCLHLKRMTISSSVTNIAGNALRSVGLETITIEGSPACAAYFLAQCTSLREIHFKSAEPPVVTRTRPFYQLPTTCVIYVPAGALAAYQSAANYPDPATYTYVEE